MKTSKRICKNGAITLPKPVRAEAGLYPGNAVDITTTVDGTITIKPASPCCRFCGSPDKVISVDNIIICRNCATKILSEVDKTND